MDYAKRATLLFCVFVSLLLIFTAVFGLTLEQGVLSAGSIMVAALFCFIIYDYFSKHKHPLPSFLEKPSFHEVEHESAKERNAEISSAGKSVIRFGVCLAISLALVLLLLTPQVFGLSEEKVLLVLMGICVALLFFAMTTRELVLYVALFNAPLGQDVLAVYRSGLRIDKTFLRWDNVRSISILRQGSSPDKGTQRFRILDTDDESYIIDVRDDISFMDTVRAEAINSHGERVVVNF